MRRLMILAVLVLLLLTVFFSATAFATVDTYLITQLTRNDTEDEDPQVFGNGVVWSGPGGSDGGSDREVFAWALGADIVQTVNAVEDKKPQLWDDLVVWSGQGGRDGGTDFEIFAWHTSGGLLQTTNDTDDLSPQVSLGGIVWCGAGGSDGGTDEEIFVQGHTGGVVQLTANDGFDDYPEISGYRLVWRSYDGHDSEIFTWTPAGGPVQITSNHYFDYFPQVWLDRVVWSGFGGSDGGGDLEIFTWTPTTGMLQLTANDIDDEEVQVSGDRVVWLSQGGTDGGRDREIMSWTPADGLVQITSGDDQDYGPQVFGNRIVWGCAVGAGDLEGSYMTSDILTWTPADGIVRVTMNGYYDGHPQVWGDRIAWEGVRGADGGEDTEIFTAVPVAAFSDVPADDPYFEAITRIRVVGVIDGYEAGGGWEFRPSQPVKRAQFAKMLSGVVGLAVREDAWPNATVPFTDLGEDVLPAATTGDSLYPHEYVTAAYLAGITRGTTATTFAPYDGITRAQLVTMVVRAMESLHPGDLETPPGDFRCAIGDFDPLHGPNVRIAEYNELLTGLVGYGPGWSAWAPATRAETAQILWNLLYGFL